MNKLAQQVRWFRLVGVLIAILSLPSCVLSPTMVGHGRGEMRPGGQFPCGEASLKSSNSLYSSVDGNNRLKCAMSEASALRNDYLREIGHRDLARNSFFAAATVASAVIALNSIDETFGPADVGPPAARTAAVLFTGFGLNRLFNNPGQQGLFRAGAKAILCEQAAIFPYLTVDDEYIELVTIMRGNRTDGTFAARFAKARSAYRNYRTFVAASSESTRNLERPYLDEVQQILDDAKNARDWAAFYLGQVENNAPDRLMRRIRFVKETVDGRLDATRVSERDVTTFIAAAPVQITSLLGSFSEQQSEENSAVTERLERANDDGDAGDETAPEPSIRNKLENALALLEQDVIYIAGLSQEFTKDTKADFERLEKANQCNVEFDETSLGITVSLSSHDFTHETAGDVSFSVTHGQSPYEYSLSSTDKGVTVDFNEATGKGVIKYDGQGAAGELVLSVSEAFRSSAGEASIRIRIVAKAKANNGGAADNVNTERGITSAASLPRNRVAAIQLGLSSGLGIVIEADGVFTNETANQINDFRRNWLKAAPAQLESLDDVDYVAIAALLSQTSRQIRENTVSAFVSSQERNISIAEKKLLYDSMCRRLINEIPSSEYTGGAFSSENRLAIIWYQYLINGKPDVSIPISGYIDNDTRLFIKQNENE